MLWCIEWFTFAAAGGEGRGRSVLRYINDGKVRMGPNFCTLNIKSPIRLILDQNMSNIPKRNLNKSPEVRSFFANPENSPAKICQLKIGPPVNFSPQKSPRSPFSNLFVTNIPEYSQGLDFMKRILNYSCRR